jgi:hypothetical protein
VNKACLLQRKNIEQDWDSTTLSLPSSSQYNYLLLFILQFHLCAVADAEAEAAAIAHNCNWIVSIFFNGYIYYDVRSRNRSVSGVIDLFCVMPLILSFTSLAQYL